MPKDTEKQEQINANITNIADTISQGMDDIYRSTYMSTPQQSNDLKDLTDRINNSINNIVTRNRDMVGMASVSSLYSRMANNTKTSKVIDELETMFDSGVLSDDLYGVFMSNRFLKELDNEIDTVCKYMPKLEEALQVQRDCVLSADHFSKDFLTFRNTDGSEDETIFSEHAKDIKKKYDLDRLVDEIYMDTVKYGEQFIYRIPYATAIGKLLATKPDTDLVPPSSYGLHESAEESIEPDRFVLKMNKDKFNIFGESSSNAVLTENATHMIEKFNKRSKKMIMEDAAILKNDESITIGLEISRSCVLESAVRETEAAYKKKKFYTEQSLSRMHEASVLKEAEAKDIKASGNIDIGQNRKSDIPISNDGLIGSVRDKVEPVKVSAPGCVVKKLPREQVIPIYIEDICMGYYYFELKTTDDSESFMGFKNILGDPLTNMRGDKRSAFNNVDTQRQDDTIKYIAGKLSSFIDKQFVNSNQDLAKEIYMILKYNDLFNKPSVDLIKVTFIPPEDMVHFFFRQDPVTHRGISDLDKALVPAKIYSSLYITTSIGTLTRGQDKRMYYVKQTVDTNISQTLLNTIAQIKQGNFGIRQFQNINNVLNITGRFNDYVIPVNMSGDPPISFEVMPGQNIEAPTELMDKLEEMAINTTGIPIEIIQARQSIDYAMQLTMSSSKVLRFCYKRQDLYQSLLEQLISPIYNYEYGTNINIGVELPPPSFINVTNTNQLVDNTKNFVNSIVETELIDEQDDRVRNIYTRELFKHYIGTHLDVSSHAAIYEKAKLLAAKDTDESHSNGESDY